MNFKNVYFIADVIYYHNIPVELGQTQCSVSVYCTHAGSEHAVDLLTTARLLQQYDIKRNKTR